MIQYSYFDFLISTEKRYDLLRYVARSTLYIAISERNGFGLLRLSTKTSYSKSVMHIYFVR